jgi:two-component system, LytTR family, sensor kinase
VLRAQLHPHFLFNTLNAVSALIATDPTVARRMIARLGDLLRMAIDPGRGAFSTLDAELDFARVYLDIEQMRMGRRLQVFFDIDPDLAELMVPSLLLQPLAENAVRHGLAPRREGGTLRISAARTGQGLAIEVEDDGVGTSVEYEGVGLGHLRRRIEQIYGTAARLTIYSRPEEGFRVRMELPL